MECPSCHKEYKNNFDIFSIQASKRCVDCQKIWMTKPENDPDLKKFEIYYSFKSTETTWIYAKDEEEAREKFTTENDDDFQIQEITEIKRK